MDSLILEHIDLALAVADCLVAGTMVLSALGSIWCVNKIIDLIFDNDGSDIRPEDRA